MPIYFILCVINQHYVICCIVQIISAFAIESSFRLALNSFDMPSSFFFFITSLPYSTTSCSRLI